MASSGRHCLLAWATSTIRRRYDTHNLVAGVVSNSRTDRLSLDLSYLRKEGPLLDGFRRPHRIQARNRRHLRHLKRS